MLRGLPPSQVTYGIKVRGSVAALLSGLILGFILHYVVGLL
jgi:hypothetical protein